MLKNMNTCELKHFTKTVLPKCFIYPKITHERKQTKSPTRTEKVWKCDLTSHKIWPTQGETE